jgi:type IV pilus assembly protein PilA
MLSSAIQRLNDRRHAAGDVGEDAGFTLIELMVVLLILAILLAIAIPTFLGVTKSANDRATQSNLNTAIINAKAQYQSGGQTYWIGGAQNSASLASTLQTAEPALAFYAGVAGTGAATATGAGATFGSSGAQSVVSVNVSVSGNGLVLAAYSKSGNCFYEVDTTQALTTGAGNDTASSPYTGTAITTTATALASGAIAMPTVLGTSYVQVKGDSTTSDCNAYSPKTNGSATVQYLTTGFPS